MKLQLILLLFSSIFISGCFFDKEPECPGKQKQQLFPLQEYNTSDINITYWKEGDSNNTFIITTESDFSKITEKNVYYKESLKNIIKNIKTYNDHIQSNNKD